MSSADFVLNDEHARAFLALDNSKKTAGELLPPGQMVVGDFGQARARATSSDVFASSSFLDGGWLPLSVALTSGLSAARCF
jgi:hypothetical protein